MRITDEQNAELQVINEALLEQSRSIDRFLSRHGGPDPLFSFPEVYHCRVLLDHALDEMKLALGDDY
ncbi:MAG: hypothetical protein OXL37_17910 [Chloroflexota bacterium]|nr:hypothetical protein [Chloroflexota bacterium]MDE2958846.1 hypothetical protein [Chloroflexota bacterium]